MSEVELDGHETPIVTHDHSLTMLRGAALCAAGGTVLGGVSGWIVSLASRTESTSILTSPPAAFALIGAAFGAAVGSLMGSLIGLGVRQSASERDSLVFPRAKARVYVQSTDMHRPR